MKGIDNARKSENVLMQTIKGFTESPGLKSLFGSD